MTADQVVGALMVAGALAYLILAVIVFLLRDDPVTYFLNGQQITRAEYDHLGGPQ